MTDKYGRRLNWVKSISQEELEKRFKEAKALAATAKGKISFYEKELERRKQEVLLGVPSKLKSDMYYFLNSKNEVVYPTTIDNKWDGLDRQSACNVFASYDSAEKHAEMLLAWRQALVANSKGEPIDIKVLLPLLPKGWVACDSDGEWFVFSCKPFIRQRVGSKDEGVWDSNQHTGFRGHLSFNIKPAEDWRNSLMECGL